MKHPSSRAFYAYWDAQRGDMQAPYRSAIEPGPIRELLGDIFVLSYDAAAGFPLRVAGTRVCALLGGDHKSTGFAQLFAPGSRDEILDIVSNVSDELLVAVAGVTGTTASGATRPLELLLLPFRARAHTPLSLTGLLVPLFSGHDSVTALTVTSMRYLAHRRPQLAPRILRRLTLSRGLVVYEGSR